MISVIIPTYKDKGNLSLCLNSVLNQSYVGDLEVIVVDDNDPDSPYRAKTESVMQSFRSIKTVKYIQHRQNLNGAAARNTGIKASKGDYIAFLDDDDFFLPSKLEKQFFFLNNHPEFDAVYCLAKSGNREMPQIVLEGDCTKEILLLQSNFYTPSLMFRRSALETINGFDESFRRHQDYELLLRFFHAGFKIGCVPEILIDIGGNGPGNALTGNNLEEMKKSFLEKFSPYIDKLNEQIPGFRNHVIAIHYSKVFLTHIKHGNLWKALLVFINNFYKSPAAFTKVIIQSIRLHLKR